MQRESAVHLVVDVTSGSSILESGTEDAATRIGVETITEGKAIARVMVTSTFAYLSGNTSGLTTILGLSTAEAEKVGKDWVSLKSGTTQYSRLKTDVTISSVLSVLPAAEGTKLSTGVVNGTKVFVLSWTTAATSSAPRFSSTLTISAVGAALPIKEIATTSRDQETISLSKWDEPVSPSAPPASLTIAYSKVTG